MISECPICKSKNIVKLTDDNNVYGLVSLRSPDKVDLNNYLPVNAFCCKDCGYVPLFHIQPDAIHK